MCVFYALMCVFLFFCALLCRPSEADTQLPVTATTATEPSGQGSELQEKGGFKDNCGTVCLLLAPHANCLLALGQFTSGLDTKAAETDAGELQV